MGAQKWFKFYGQEYLSDPKIERLTPTERSCWVTLLCMASTTDGIIRFLTIETLLNRSGIQFDPYHPEEWEKGLGVLRKFQDLEMIRCAENGDITILNWSKRQETNLSDAERAKSYRDRKKERHVNVTDNVTNVTQEKSRIDKSRVEEREKPKASISFLEKVPQEVLTAFSEEYSISLKGIQSKATDLLLWCQSKSKVYRDYKAFLENAIRKDQVQLRSQYPVRTAPVVSQSVKEAAEFTPEQVEANKERIAKMREGLVGTFKK